MGLIVRESKIEDVDILLSLVRKLAIHENKKPEEIKLSVDKIKKHGFGVKPYFHSLIVELNKQAIGYVIYFYSYATTVGAPILILEEMFVEETYRHKGIGKTLFAELATIAVKNGCCRMEWSAFIWNEKAIQLYKSLGATRRMDVFQFRVAGEELVEMAEG